MVTEGWANSGQQALLRLINALEVGDWGGALWYATTAAGDSRHELPRLWVIVRTIARGIGAEATGDVPSARRQLFDAAAMLPAGLTRRDRDDRCFALLTPEPPGGSCAWVSRLTWLVSRLIWREQSLMADTMKRLIESQRPRDHMVEAGIQFMMEVEFSPFAWSSPHEGAEPNDPPVIPTRSDMCRRATTLRKAAVPTAGDVSKTVWVDMGGYRGLRAKAMARLAVRPLTPWAEATDLRAGVPLRIGRRRAWEHAQLWIQDLDYQMPA